MFLLAALRAGGRRRSLLGGRSAYNNKASPLMLPDDANIAKLDAKELALLERRLASSLTSLRRARRPGNGQLASVTKRRVKSHTVPGKFYTLTRTPRGTWRCSCPDFIYRPKKRPCKHIEALNT